MVAGLAKGWPKSKTASLSEEADKALAVLLAKLPGSAKGQLLRLASTLGSKGLEKYRKDVTEALVKTIGDEKQPDEVRIESARQLVEFEPRNGEFLDSLLDTVHARSSPQLSVGIIDALPLQRLPDWDRRF